MKTAQTGLFFLPKSGNCFTIKAMARTYIAETKNKVGERVELFGWVKALRKQGGISFIGLRDKTGSIQAVTRKQDEVFTAVDELSTESVIKITGLVKEEKQAPDGVEVVIESLEILSKADPELPIPIIPQKGGGEVEISKRFDWRWIDLRREEMLPVFKVWTELERGFREYFEKADYLQIYTPSLMNAASESGAEVFKVDYFGREAFLAQSPQFYKQMAMAAGLERVFMVGPVFRAEPSFTPRHMTEFTGWDFEISFIESHHDVMAEEEKAIVSGFQRVKDALAIDLEIPALPFPKVSLSEAKQKLKTAGVKSTRPDDFTPEEERELSKIIKQETGHDFVFVTEYPVTARPFYHMRLEDNPKLTKSFDLFYKGVEVTTGAQREHRLEQLEKQAKEKKTPLAPLANYLNFFRYGCPPHGGAGIGPGRIVMKILDIDSVKDVTFLPRDVKRLTP